MSEVTPVNVTVTYQIGTGQGGFTYSASPAEGVTFSTTSIAKASLSGDPAGPHNWAFIYQLAGPGVGDTLVWDTSPIAWTEGPPPTVESRLTLPTPSANQIVLGVHNDNTSGSQAGFHFRLKVIDHGVPVESPDPEIILDPP